MRAVPARIFALLAALVLLLPSGASTRTEYYCRMMGRIVGSVSCDNEAASQSASPIQQIQEADCCQRLSASSRSASLSTREAVQGVTVAALLTTAPQEFVAGLQRDTGSLCAESTQAPLAIGPPLFIVHCAFLS
ncbi:MAG: hypothetical protein ABW061_19940 [Polyangiaceae bacterium]